MKLVIEGTTREARALAFAHAMHGLYAESMAEPTPDLAPMADPTLGAGAVALGEPRPKLANGLRLSPLVGGRTAALARLRAFDVWGYANGRNDVFRGSVSRLAAYFRYGVLSLAEVRDHMLTSYDRSTPGVGKFINELAWRAFWRSVYARKGKAIWQDIEPPKYTPVTLTPRHITFNAADLPADILAANTGLTCMDEGLRELYTTGYVHNHWRMWFAAYVLFWRGLHWSQGAALFERHLICGEPAVNNLSWQWNASTFSAKPYVFNKENVWKFSDGRYCRACPAHATNTCPFDADYANIHARFFDSTDDTQPKRNDSDRRDNRGNARRNRSGKY